MAEGSTGIVNQREAARLECLRRLLVLDAPQDDRLDTIVSAAARGFGVKTALISLVDQHRQWFLARVGLSLTETSREMAFCDCTIRTSLPLIVENTLEDSRFAKNPLVTGAPHVRFYAGAPLIAEGRHRIGTLCIIDFEPRNFADAQISQLVGMAKLCMLEINRFANQRKLAQRLKEMKAG
ncbi:MAG: GAF domain-containing protein [Hyphomonadaceae bacterium]|nr:GAF domain-containing protein [Hyphomonadaceae bacterium]